MIDAKVRGLSVSPSRIISEFGILAPNAMVPVFNLAAKAASDLDKHMTPEGKIKAAVKRVLNELGAYYHSPVQNGMGAPCLDIHGCYHGIYFAVETKAPGKVPTPRQELTITTIARAGGLVFVISSLEGAAELGRRLVEAYDARHL